VSAVITRITGALVQARPVPGAALYELARVGERGLLGEVIRVERDAATIQVYEETTGLRLGEPVETAGSALAITLGPGLLGAVLDGTGRPLGSVAQTTGDFILPGVVAPTLNPAARWRFEPRLPIGTAVAAGDVLGLVQEHGRIEHRILVPPSIVGVVAELDAGDYAVTDAVGRLEDGTQLHLAHTWPVRDPRPVAARLPLERPFVTRQRVFDFLFPVAEGGSVAVPGGFGTGKTIIEQSLAKFADADMVVYVGCGERGNEMAEVLAEFPGLLDPGTDRPVMERTVLVVNTSNMPVAAREASVYVGVTIAEYYRDMGYRVAVMADSLSRWAEALREMGARLQEMPGEEGYPTYLGNRLGKWYERAGRVRPLGSPEREGTLTIISAVSPPGGDLSEPVTQTSVRVTGALWALDASLANQRHFPAVDWETSYSLYEGVTARWFAETVAPEWPAARQEMLALLERDRELREIAGLVGQEALQDRDRLLLAVARVVREAVLAQDAYDPNDAASSPARTYRLVELTRRLYQGADEALARGVALDRLDLGQLGHRLVALRRTPDDAFTTQADEAEAAIAALGQTAVETA
jgi:V/A-type H+-transporting ATPase subunit A